MDKYYIVMKEWLMPNESGREFVEEYDTLEQALGRAEKECQAEEDSSSFFGNVQNERDFESYEVNSQLDTNKKIGWMISEKNGLTDYFFFVRVIEVPKFEYHGKEI